MGKVLSVASRKMKRFNVENRAFKVISQEKPVPAPKHPSSLKEIDQIKKEHGDTLKELMSKHAQLDQNLKSVYVTSTENDINKFGKPSDRERLPVNRSSTSQEEFGYQEPEIIPPGKITLKQALQVLTNRDASKELTAEKIANTLKIKQEDAVNLVNYFSSLNVYMPEAVPQLSSTKRASQMFLKSLSLTKVTSVEGSPKPQLENPIRSKPG